ncbi:MAG: hypothetical protein EPO07_19615 [Verrucomicrobia bacterium]|nr:MAG: hypothetical protein EPO07_19615 [Verrucomicrobiota bacterium]
MPIRLNLLAEAQAAEELRRRDPVKRAMWIGALLAVLMLGWSAYVWVQSLAANKKLEQVKVLVSQQTNEYQTVLDDQKKLVEVRAKLGALRQLATNRFLNGTLLNALQQRVLNDVQLLKLKVEEQYVANEETKAKTNENGRVVSQGKPASVTERVIVTLDARDNSSTLGDGVTKYKEELETSPYFQALLNRTNELRMFNFVQTRPQDGPAYVSFTLECRLPEKMR